MKNRLIMIVVVLAIVGLVVLFGGGAGPDWLREIEAPFQDALESGNWSVALVFIYLAGLGTALTPCVYPMIIITVSVFGAREAKSKLQGALLSGSFVLGIAALFTPLGIISAMGGDLFGSWLSNPWVLAGLAFFFIALSLSMFGLYELNLPPALQNKLAQVGGVGHKGAFLMGLVSGLIAAPCVGPPLLLLLSYIGTTGDMAFGGLGLFVYSIGLGTLFFFVGTFAVALPKSGRWLEWVKSIFGTVMLVMAVYYLRDFLPFEKPSERALVWIGSGVALIVAGIALGAVDLTYHDPSKKARVMKTLGITSIVLGAMAVVLWLQALPPGAKIEWMHEYAEARELAEDADRPFMVDFTASWCGACGELTQHTFSDPRVVAAVRDANFVSAKIDLSPGQDSQPRKDALASYNQQGLPLVVLHDRDGVEVTRVTQFIDADEFLQLLEELE